MRSGRKSEKAKKRGGFTLMETLVVIGLTVVILAIFTAASSTVVFLRKAGYAIQASDFVREELDSLRVLPFTELINRTNGDFLGLSLTRGDWKVKAVAGAPSGNNVLALETAKSALNQETGQAVVPWNYHRDTDATAHFYVKSSSPSGWGAGLGFQYRDLDNHYRFRITSGGAAIDKVYHGTITTLCSNNVSYATDTWYTLEVTTVGTAITAKVNGSNAFSTGSCSTGSLTDSTFSTGDVTLQTLNSALVYIDDVSILENSSTTSWDFESDTVGQEPLVWQRFVYFDLPSGSATLTIADYLSQSTIKQVTATITWVDQGVTKTVSGSTLIAQ
jgi:hypothetical protein